MKDRSEPSRVGHEQIQRHSARSDRITARMAIATDINMVMWWASVLIFNTSGRTPKSIATLHTGDLPDFTYGSSSRHGLRDPISKNDGPREPYTCSIRSAATTSQVKHLPPRSLTGVHSPVGKESSTLPTPSSCPLTSAGILSPVTTIELSIDCFRPSCHTATIDRVNCLCHIAARRLSFLKCANQRIELQHVKDECGVRFLPIAYGTSEVASNRKGACQMVPVDPHVGPQGRSGGD